MITNHRRNRIKALAEKSGFILYSKEEDPNTPIDWSSDYTQELERFAQNIVEECATFCRWEEAQDMFDHFGIKRNG